MYLHIYLTFEKENLETNPYIWKRKSLDGYLCTYNVTLGFAVSGDNTRHDTMNCLTSNRDYASSYQKNFWFFISLYACCPQLVFLIVHLYKSCWHYTICRYIQHDAYNMNFMLRLILSFSHFKQLLWGGLHPRTRAHKINIPQQLRLIEIG